MTSELFERYGPTVYRRCLTLLKDPVRAEDATQEVFLRVLQHGHRFRGDSSMATWLYRIATTHCLQRLRNQRRRAEKLRTIRVESVETQTPESDMAWWELVAPLAPETQQLVIYRYIDGCTLEETAALLGVSRKTVQKRLQRFGADARERLAGLQEGS